MLFDRLAVYLSSKGPTKTMSDKISYVTVNGQSRESGFLEGPRAFRLLVLALLVAPLINSCQTQPAPKGPIPHILVLGLDGIPFTTFKKMQDGGHFRNFNTVAPMVASFPSISDPNWALLYQTGPENNFTKAYYDPTIKTSSGMGGENGGLMAHMSKEPVYERIMDFKVQGVWEHLSTFIWTDTTSRYWLESLQTQFFDFSGRDTYFALIINTDLVSHTEGELNLMQYLAKIEETIDKIQKRYHEKYGTDLEVIVVSDHGNAFSDPKDVPYEKTLEGLGWAFPATISGPKDVGFYVPELLSFGAFYCQAASARALAQDFSKVPQVQSAMYMMNPRDIRVFSQNSETKIIYDPATDLLDYKIIRGKDPFNQEKYFSRGPIKGADYFQKSLIDPYPFALVRIWEGFNINAKIQAQVLVNPTLGSVFGNKALRLLTNLRGFASSHGSLHRDETFGIFASTARTFSAIRPQEFSKIVNVKPLMAGR